MRWYLCGGINGLSDAEAMDWREAVKTALGGRRCLDPMRRDYRGREGDFGAEIVAGDLADIDAADGLIVNAARPSWGTAMEVFYAYRAGKTVVTVVPGGPVSPWLQQHSSVVLASLDEAIAYVQAAERARGLAPVRGLLG